MTPGRALAAFVCTASLATALGAGAADADVAGPDDSIQQAFGPLAPATWYAGQFKGDGDVDYLAVRVQEPSLTLHVDVENTVSPCMSVWLNGCPIWATFIDGQSLQVGGEGSSAGTGQVDAGASDVIDWTFAAPGTYFLAMDSAGDLPTYRVRYLATAPPAYGPGGAGGPGAGGEPPGAGAGGGAGSATTPAASLTVTRRQRGNVVRARIVVRRPLRSLTVSVGRTGAKAYATRRLTAVRAGRRTVVLRLGPAGRRALARAGRLRLAVRLVAVPVAGSRLILRRAVILDRPRPR